MGIVASVVIFAEGPPSAACSGNISAVLRVSTCTPVLVATGVTIYLTLTSCSVAGAQVLNYLGDHTCSVTPMATLYSVMNCTGAGALGPGSPPLSIACCPPGTSATDTSLLPCTTGSSGQGSAEDAAAAAAAAAAQQSSRTAGAVVGVALAVLLIGAVAVGTRRKRFVARRILAQPQQQQQQQQEETPPQDTAEKRNVAWQRRYPSFR